MTDEKLAQEGVYAKRALDEFLKPAFDKVRAEYMEALTAIAATEPWQSDKITKLAIATRVIDMVEGHILALVSVGEVAGVKIERAKDIAKIPAARRKILGI